MSTENVRSPQPWPDANRPAPEKVEPQRYGKFDDGGPDNELPSFPMAPPVSWPRVFPGL